MKTIKQHQPTSNNLKQPKEQLKQLLDHGRVGQLCTIFGQLSSKEMVLDQPSTRMERGGTARPSDRGQQRVSVLYLTPADMVRQCKQFKTMQNMQVFLAEYFAVFSCPLFQVLNCYSRICTVATDNVLADAHVSLEIQTSHNISEAPRDLFLFLFPEVWKGTTNWAKEAGCNFFWPFVPWTLQLLFAWSFQFLRCIQVYHCISYCIPNVSQCSHAFPSFPCLLLVAFWKM